MLCASYLPAHHAQNLILISRMRAADQTLAMQITMTKDTWCNAIIYTDPTILKEGPKRKEDA